jgi:hypothetical protein
MENANELKVNEKDAKGIIDDIVKTQRDNLKFSASGVDYANDFFSKIKISFWGFFGIFLTLIFNNQSNFSQNFLLIIFIIFILVTSGIIYDFWIVVMGKIKSFQHHAKRVYLGNIMNITINEGQKYYNYGFEAQKMARNDDEILKDIFNDKPISKMISDFDRKNLKIYPTIIELVIWSIIIFAIPISFILELLKIL